MATNVKKFNPFFENFTLIDPNDDFDYHQDVARASFADMLHDKERNKKYELGLKAAINKMHAKGKKANVLDIGTGSGLLSMMAVRNGADSVTACEGFQPMSNCAGEVLKQNGLHDKIKIIAKRSTDLYVGCEHVQEKYNILVTEVFDTELIGEDALFTFKHALEFLLEDDCIVVPESATVFAQVVECPLAQKWNKLNDIYGDNGELLVAMPETVKTCKGIIDVHDIQLNQLPVSSFKTIVSPKPVFKFDWSGKTELRFKRSEATTAISEADGIAQIVFMWWELQMDTDGEVILSCAPHWAHPDRRKYSADELPWRDHWIQGIYFLPKELNVQEGQLVHLISYHDEYKFWFHLTDRLPFVHESITCECVLHKSFSRTRIGQMNDVERNSKLFSLFKRHINADSIVLILSEGFYFGLAAARIAKKVYVYERNEKLIAVMDMFIKSNSLENVDIIDNHSLSLKDVNHVSVVLSEPFSANSILPWDNLSYLRSLLNVREYLSPNIRILPKKAIIKGVAVHFIDLYKIRASLGTCEGFIMNAFDSLIEESSGLSDEIVEAQPLWEYPGIALSPEIQFVEIDLVDIPYRLPRYRSIFPLEGDLSCNGIALWIEWDMDGTPEHVISTGPVSPIQIGKKIDWYMYTRQGVYLFPNKKDKDIAFEFQYEDGKVILNCI